MGLTSFVAKSMQHGFIITICNIHLWRSELVWQKRNW